MKRKPISIEPDALPSLASIQAAVQNPDRLQVLRRSGLLDAPPSQVFSHLTQQAAQLLDAPVALLTLVDEHRDFVMGQVGLPAELADAREIPIQPSFCALTVAQGETLIINDTQADSYFRLFPSVETSGVRAHLGVPLFYRGRPIGNCCVIDVKPREWTAANIETLEGLAQVAMAAIEAQAAQAGANAPVLS